MRRPKIQKMEHGVLNGHYLAYYDDNGVVRRVVDIDDWWSNETIVTKAGAPVIGFMTLQQMRVENSRGNLRYHNVDIRDAWRV